MSGSGREAFPDVQEWTVVVGKPSRMSGSGRRLSLISGSGREALRMSGSSRKTLPDV